MSSVVWMPLSCSGWSWVYFCVSFKLPNIDSGSAFGFEFCVSFVVSVVIFSFKLKFHPFLRLFRIIYFYVSVVEEGKIVNLIY